MVPCELSVPNFFCSDFSAYILFISKGLAIGPVSPNFFGRLQKVANFFFNRKKKWGKLVRLPNPLRWAICMCWSLGKKHLVPIAHKEPFHFETSEWNAEMLRWGCRKKYSKNSMKTIKWLATFSHVIFVVLETRQSHYRRVARESRRAW